ncbi:60S ribosomal protein L13a-like [Triticum dicoccoides]|uniref:60S ribosomal protein L13a-like n=1 Tax=Triticum dicoccoides TaxID=85692 RepID=UPI0018914C7F|nr:60S ribosomal protein L13a-like [Triticum dicoccoides]
MAFLNGNLTKDVYMTQPEGFVDPKKSSMLCKLQRSIYGLRQASRNWNIRFNEGVKEFGFIKNYCDHCVFKKPLGRRHHWDAHHHMLGHLASIITKELLNGQRLVVVRFEEICMSGGLVHQNMKYLHFLRKRMNTKPSHGPIHFRAPAKILWRTIRGMIPHKTARGEAVLAKLKAYEGVPLPYDRTKHMVIPDTLKVLRLQPRHKHCLLGQLSKEVGWNYADTIRELQA